MTREEEAIKTMQEMLKDCHRKSDALSVAIAALREKAERERGCAYCVIGKRSPDAEYCSNCGRKLTPTLPELANESEEVNPDSHQYVDNYSTNRRKSVREVKNSQETEVLDFEVKNSIRKNSDNCEQGKPYPQEQANVRIEEDKE
jgi:predicted amidophosphoribosyltransferase